MSITSNSVSVIRILLVFIPATYHVFSFRPNLNKIPDIDVILTGKPKSVRDKITIVIDTIKRFEEQHGYATDNELRNELLQRGLTEYEISKILTKLA